MAIFLIKDRDATHHDPAKEQRGCYKRGDVVEVYADDKPLVVPPAPPFYLMRVGGISKAQGDVYIEPETSGVLDADGVPVMTRRRRYSVNLTALPQGAKDDLAFRRYCEVDWTDLRPVVLDKKTVG